ncbi:hypothetical protein C9413_08170 [Rhizobium sp. SEMIA 4085]|uniref:Uncharacterized protein n=1 Tax=Rhizobium gallicum bv. gallicum R602sp TaxID=1041138 RepID=A0A0B4XED3_9HYPH|nr:hypothetical protein [Rhizobium sp. SEMIA 4085]AJD44973.1 hypothetical protein RGR602_PC00940 [Rhizobium gallicum bv. gallicum R602sp]NNH29473.1 hypothetical protein [Rhizobium sp. SEMIA 4085]
MKVTNPLAGNQQIAGTTGRHSPTQPVLHHICERLYQSTHHGAIVRASKPQAGFGLKFLSRARV